MSHFIRDYREHVARLRSTLAADDAFRAAVGGEFHAIGQLERATLEQHGLGNQPAYVIDVGCGSGRLAFQLAAEPHVSYLGTDVVPELLAYAAQLSARPDWRFLPTSGSKIPSSDNEADFVCFFSVFTHLLHQETFRYLAEAKRAVKKNGMIMFTFLEYRIGCH